MSNLALRRGAKVEKELPAEALRVAAGRGGVVAGSSDDGGLSGDRQGKG